MINEDDMGVLLELTFEHYDIRYPHGTQVSIRCPVHDDSQASATANMAKGLWHCLACGAGGTAVHLIAHREGLEISDAYRYAEGLLDRSGRAVSTGSAWIPGGRVSGRKRNRSSGGKYRPSWLDS